MAITEVGGGSQRAAKLAVQNVDSTTLAFPGNVTAGSLLIVAGNNYKAVAATSIVVTDTLGTTYTTLLSASQDSSRNTFIAYGIAPSSGANTVTVDPEGTGNYPFFAIDEFSGVDSTTPLDVDGGVSTGTSTTPSDGLTTVTAGALIIGVEGYTNSSTTVTTPGGDYTQIGEQENSSAYMGGHVVFRLATTAQAYTVDWTLATSRNWFAKTAAFKPASGSLLPPPSPMAHMLVR